MHDPQTVQILQFLKDAGPAGVCSNTFLRLFIARAAARIHDLRSAGHMITSQRCVEHSHRGNVARYVLEQKATAE